ncbi:unnamed protein product [Staurois parvus]|uniref:Uncharacterized protein n=1 Tax=Staurois parvus TaxID=386267 RepID=A0ABN9CKZ8_9NEOB|nr:unnamed protein product [Staurois parvus]
MQLRVTTYSRQGLKIISI